jgi:hypothetical protein
VKEKSKDFILFYDSSKALELFMFCQSQWHYHFSGIAGLDYTAVLSVIKLQIKSRKKQLWMLEQIKALEQGALMAWGDKAAVDRSNDKDSKHKLSSKELVEIEERRAWRC